MNQTVYKQTHWSHPLKRSFICTPDVQTNVLNARYDEDHFPTAKYIMVTKVYDSKKEFKLRGQPSVTRYYSIGILTTMNQYFYSEVHTRLTVLTNTLVEDFKHIFLTHYTWNLDTQILITDNIDIYEEPVATFLNIVSSAKKLTIRRADLRQMLKALNDVFKYIKPTKKKDFKFTSRNNKRMIDRLFKHKRFEFITDPYWELRLETMGTTERRANVETAVGILYMYIKDYRRNIRYESVRRRKEREEQEEKAKLEEKQYNINGNDNKKEEDTNEVK